MARVELADNWEERLDPAKTLFCLTAMCALVHNKTLCEYTKGFRVHRNHDVMRGIKDCQNKRNCLGVPPETLIDADKISDKSTCAIREAITAKEFWQIRSDEFFAKI